jgi:N-acetylglutamate synthase-like GNAT family acetyltransferase
LAALFWRFHKVISSYVEKSLADDLLDIQKFYMSNPQSHFFVAVGAGCDGNNAAESVLGCVALEYKPDDKTYAGWGELRRMSVAKAGRRRGIASQLNNAVLAHAEAQKLKGVFLVLSFRLFTGQPYKY